MIRGFRKSLLCSDCTVDILTNGDLSNNEYVTNNGSLHKLFVKTLLGAVWHFTLLLYVDRSHLFEPHKPTEPTLSSSHPVSPFQNDCCAATAQQSFWKGETSCAAQPESIHLLLQCPQIDAQPAPFTAALSFAIGMYLSGCMSRLV